MYIFNVNLSDEDYVEFNKFVSIQSAYGKKQMRGLRIWVAAIMVLLCALSLWTEGFTEDGWIACISYIIVFVSMLFLLKPLMLWLIKLQVKFVKKNGKLPYSMTAVMSFDEEGFSETTEEEKTEMKYFGIERVSVLPNRFIYLHKNNLMAYIFPYASFESKEQGEEFLSFLKEVLKYINTKKL